MPEERKIMLTSLNDVQNTVFFPLGPAFTLSSALRRLAAVIISIIRPS
jgi:hypothetical protein